MSAAWDESHFDSSRGAIIDMAEQQGREVRRIAAVEIQKIEDRRDEELRRLEGAVVVLGGPRSTKAKPSTAPRSAPASPRAPRRRKKGKSPVEKALENREAVLDLLEEADREMAIGEVRSILNLGEHAAGNALKRLVGEGKVRKTGVGAGTKYIVVKKGREGSTAAAQPEGTLAGRVLLVLDERGSASEAELAQAFRVPIERIKEVCDKLTTEGEIRMSVRGGVRVYLRLRAA